MPLNAYLLRARELHGTYPVVAHYLKLFYLELALAVSGRSAADKRFVLQLLGEVEAEQATLKASKQLVAEELRALAQLLDVRALAQAHAGHLDAAFADALLTVRLGERIATGDDVTLVGAMVGGRIQELGYARIRSLLEARGATALAVSAWLERLGDAPIPEEARQRVWAGEYQALNAIAHWTLNS